MRSRRVTDTVSWAAPSTDTDTAHLHSRQMAGGGCGGSGSAARTAAGGKRGLLPALSRQVLSVSSWFRISEQGMKEFEPLSRGTAFCLRPPPHTPHAHCKHKRVVLTCSHVVAPYRWTQHFREPWLEFVRDVHVECRLQLWQDGGRGLSAERRVRAPLHFHPTLDLCAFVYTEEEDEEGDDGIVAGTDPLVCRDVMGAAGEGALKEGEPISFLGFPISTNTTNTISPSLPTLDVQCLRHTKGRALGPHIIDKEGRRYARTEERLAVGMSGGPVLDGGGKCVGLFQGILPPPHDDVESEEGEGGEDEGEGVEREELEPVLRPLQKEAWALHAAFVPMRPVLEFVRAKGLFR